MENHLVHHDNAGGLQLSLHGLALPHAIIQVHTKPVVGRSDQGTGYNEENNYYLVCIHVGPKVIMHRFLLSG